MCGIAGIFSKNYSYSFDLYKKQLHEMTNELHRRGPDSFGFWISKKERIFLGHRRLSIFDKSSKGSQPMVSNDRRYIIIYNGEIYNFLDLKKNLISNYNVRFKSNSDTEVLLELISIFGFEKTLKKIVGMYSLVVWDDHEKKLFLSIDPLGKKPLYWGIIEKDLIFASEIKSILKFRNFQKKINNRAIDSFLKFSYVKSPLSIYKDLNKLEPGSYLVIDKSFNIKKKKYWNPINFLYKKNDEIKSSETLINELKEVIELSVKERLNADVPVGVMLSGGIDSSLVSSIAQNISSKKIKTFTVAFQDRLFDESKFAKKISNHLKTDHHTVLLDLDKLNETIEKIPEIYDEPFADSSQIPTYLICKNIKKKVTVALSGDGGDEIFAGYSRYIWAKQFFDFQKKFGKNFSKIISSLINLFPNNFYDILSQLLPVNIRPREFGHRIKKIAKILESKDETEIYSKLISTHNLSHLLLNYDEEDSVSFKEELQDYSFVEKMQIHDLENYLPNDILVKVDRASMFNSLEIRSPLIDKRVIEYTLKNCRTFHNIKANKGKSILRKMLNQYLPQNLYQRPKMGFGIPIDKILRHQMLDNLKYLLSEKFVKDQGIFDSKKVMLFLNSYLNGQTNVKYEIWNLFIFQSWYNKWMKN